LRNCRIAEVLAAAIVGSKSFIDEMLHFPEIIDGLIPALTSNANKNKGRNYLE